MRFVREKSLRCSPPILISAQTPSSSIGKPHVLGSHVRDVDAVPVGCDFSLRFFEIEPAFAYPLVRVAFHLILRLSAPVKY